MAAALIRGTFLAFGTVWAYKEGYIESVLKKLKDNNNTGNNAVNGSVNRQQPTQPIIVNAPANKDSSSSKLVTLIGVGAVVTMGYIYYNRILGTKQVINKVETTGKETQGLVKMTDENNVKRFNELDKRNTKRANDMEAEIRSETRAGFQVVSEQLYCLTQVCIQTLSHLANGTSNNNNDGEFCSPNDKLLGYADKAQEMAETILDDQHMIKAKHDNLKDIKAEIFQRNENENNEFIMQNGVTPGYKNTPGGPDNNDDIHQYNELNKQQPFITSFGDNNSNNANINNNNTGLTTKVLSYYNKITTISKPIINKILGDKTNNNNNFDNINNDENDLTRIKWIAGGAIVISGIALYKYWPTNNDNDKQITIYQ